jgi:hypothetical protein
VSQHLPGVQFGTDAVVIGLEKRAATRVGLGRANVLLPESGSPRSSVRWRRTNAVTIAVDRQTRIALNNQPGIERVGQLLGECCRNESQVMWQSKSIGLTPEYPRLAASIFRRRPFSRTIWNGCGSSGPSSGSFSTLAVIL